MELPNVDPPLKKTIGSIPRDETTRKKIIDIVDHQFNLEIYLKQREVATIKQEISKAESILNDLKQAVENENTAASMPETSHYTRRSAMYYHGGSQALVQHTSAPKRKVYRTMEKNKLFGRRNDGVYVSLACPACHRDDFANQQGFLNHCRISHNLEFGPYEQIMLQCGTPVDESEVPMDHPARLRPVMNLVPATRQPQKKLERPSIKVFEEDVDMELENERRISKTNESTLDNSETPIENSIPLDSEPPSEVNSEQPSEPPISQQPTFEPSTSEPSTSEPPTSEPPTSEPPTSDPNSSEPTEPSTSEKTIKPTEEPDSSTIESFAAAMTSDAGSRFYIKRRILVGNVSKYIAPEKRDPSLKQFTHKWMIYVVEPTQAKEKISSFVTCVRFYLHPSYKPHDVVDVTEPPFKLTRLGWGEFPIRIQLFFVDKRRNKAIDLIHHLKLDNTHTGRQLLGGERNIEIELDRNTDFKDIGFHHETILPKPSLPMTAVKQKMSLLGGILKECVRKLPIIRAGSHGKVLPYSCPSSSKIFFKLSVGKRKALEWHRARLLRIETQKRALEMNDNVLRTAAEAVTTKDIVIWCRTHHYTPTTSDTTTEELKESDLPFGYCKFCGSLRDGHDETMDDNCPRRPKGWNGRKKQGGINSVTSVSNLLNTLELGWDEIKDSGDDVDIDVDMDDVTIIKDETKKKYMISENVKEWVNGLDTMDVANERSIDWIWSVVGQLRLKSVIANDMLLGKDGNLQGPTSNFDLNSAMDQRLIVGNILLQATKSFLKKLVNQTVNICHKEEEGSADKSIKMMVPYHVYQTVQQSQDFDFLTNQYMGPEEKLNEPTENSS